jgi:ribonuclease D
VISEEQVDVALQFLREADKPAVARAQAEYLREWCKSVRAEIVTQNKGMSAAAALAIAEASQEYRDALEGWAEAMRVDYRNRFKREAAVALIEAWRTQCSNERSSRV